MNSSLDQLLQAFDCVAQPVFFASAGQITYANTAARQLLVAPGMPLDALTPGSRPVLDAVPDGAQQLPVQLAGGVYNAVARPMEGGRLFVVQQGGPDAGTGVQLQTLASVARTMRVPLTNLFGAAGTVFPRLEELEEPDVQRQMSSINRALYQLMHLSCNLGDFAAAAADEMRLLRERTELCDFFYGVVARTEPLCAAAGASLACELPQKLMNAWIDRQKIERCVLNLVSNAMRHADEPARISLRLLCSGKQALVQVACNQSAFSDADLAGAFSRHATSAPLPSPNWGAGFGLPLVQHIVRLHGGAMMISSPGSGGSVVVFSLPLGEPDVQTVKSPVAGMDYAGGFRHELVELADVLPLEVFDSGNVN